MTLRTDFCDSCKNNATCNRQELRCICFDGWGGDDCTVFPVANMEVTIPSSSSGNSTAQPAAIWVAVCVVIIAAALVLFVTSKRLLKVQNSGKDKFIDWEGVDDVYDDENYATPDNYAHIPEDGVEYLQDFTSETILETKLSSSKKISSFHSRKASPSEILESLKQQQASSQSSYECVPRKKEAANYDTARKEDNRGKNRYSDILPYEDTRVKLVSSVSDYINANHISLQAGMRSLWYVATQGPLKSTCEDFWRMVWEQGSLMIIMVTSEIEKGRVKCERYWPREEGEYDAIHFGQFRITLLGQVANDSYILRGLHLTNTTTGEKRSVRHLQFIAWPDKDVPHNADQFISFLDEMMVTRERLQHGQNAQPLWPTIIHCSAGVGRSGVVMLLDAALTSIQSGRIANLEVILREMRDQRLLLVQTYPQYLFCHTLLKTFVENHLQQ